MSSRASGWYTRPPGFNLDLKLKSADKIAVLGTFQSPEAGNFGARHIDAFN
jgi:hypothetical protein